MPKHDSLFKTFLHSFFADLLWLVVPDLAGSLDLAHPLFLEAKCRGVFQQPTRACEYAPLPAGRERGSSLCDQKRG